MGARVMISAADGHRLEAYRADPDGAPRGGIVVMQEAFGVNAFIESVCERYARLGYAALAPAIYDRQERGAAFGYDEADAARALAVRGRIRWDDVLADVAAAIAAVRPADKVAITGYCLGGGIAWSAACRLPVDAAIAYYGTDIPKLYNEQPRCPVLLHFAEDDRFIPAEAVALIRATHPAIPVHVYPGVHGFACDNRARSYHAESTRLADERTVAFLAAHLAS